MNPNQLHTLNKMKLNTEKRMNINNKVKISRDNIQEHGRLVYYQIYQDIENGWIIRMYDRNSGWVIGLGKHMIWNIQPTKKRSVEVQSRKGNTWHM